MPQSTMTWPAVLTPLSFQSRSVLLLVLDVLRQEVSQVMLATHSPLLSALPGATTI